MKAKMTIVKVDGSEVGFITNLCRVAVTRGVRFIYVSDASFCDGDDAIIFFEEKFNMLTFIETIKDYCDIPQTSVDDMWGCLQCKGKEIDGDIDMSFISKQKVF